MKYILLIAYKNYDEKRYATFTDKDEALKVKKLWDDDETMPVHTELYEGTLIKQ